MTSRDDYRVLRGFQMIESDPYTMTRRVDKL